MRPTISIFQFQRKSTIVFFAQIKLPWERNISAQVFPPTKSHQRCIGNQKPIIKNAGIRLFLFSLRQDKYETKATTSQMGRPTRYNILVAPNPGLGSCQTLFGVDRGAFNRTIDKTSFWQRGKVVGSPVKGKWIMGTSKNVERRRPLR